MRFYEARALEALTTQRRKRALCVSDFSVFIKPGAENINEGEMVAPTGFEPVNESQSRGAPRLRRVLAPTLFDISLLDFFVTG